jgi:hypothetical protein
LYASPFVNLHQHGPALAAADAERGNAQAAAFALQRAQQV